MNINQRSTDGWIDREQMGARAVEAMLAMADDTDGAPPRETDDVSLVVRESA
jgi:DNA-binding LacI/PurR family transcriptional regulator